MDSGIGSSGGSSGADAAGDPCAFSAVTDYKRSLNVGAVFVILFASVLGTCIPLVSKHYPWMQRYPFIFIWGKHVGTGVLVALGLIHLLAPAFDELGNPCLPAAFSEQYEYAPLFAMLAALAMHFIETIAHQYMDGRVSQTPAGPAGPYEYPGSPDRQQNPSLAESTERGKELDGDKQLAPPLSRSSSAMQDEVELTKSGDLTKPSGYPHMADAPDCIVIESPVNSQSVHMHIHSHKHTGVHTHNGHTHGMHDAAQHDHDGGHTHSLLLGNAERTIAAYVLEFGLTAHSVIIGITVGVASRTDLNTLLPALVFHQFFEGFALGARLAEVGFSIWNELSLMLIYSLSCPIGIAIGIGSESSYNGNGVTTNLVQGTFDAVSAGIILYVAFAQMLGMEFPRDYKAAKGDWRKQAALWFGLYLGAAVMAFIGKYL